MKSHQNVQIPLALFKDMIEFFYYLEFSSHCFPSIFNVRGMLTQLEIKQDSINRRKAYANIIHAKDEVQKNSARADYMQLKWK